MPLLSHSLKQIAKTGLWPYTIHIMNVRLRTKYSKIDYVKINIQVNQEKRY